MTRNGFGNRPIPLLATSHATRQPLQAGTMKIERWKELDRKRQRREKNMTLRAGAESETA
ncbi:MAG: hypothetical protein A2024_10785 [Candidatus Edwardsbacteria bacterium GWF2_54_11]|uniref:Uncharacterized protein n=1 Tax=Candidatus Edwardsbacteria bacterium GWF2_54_11 TaxID=1817851 RepID=A0A1F5RHP3_9BACT|nr:MAG: hypothetical protein A2024_10785 [Candidatus Edwardsbacteria bacterium GWF2_54_11]